MKPCISRLINHFEPFRSYFRDAPGNEKKVKPILKKLEDPKTLPILLFLEDVLPSIDTYNKTFQVSYYAPLNIYINEASFIEMF